MSDDLRDSIAATLAEHEQLFWPGSDTVLCSCRKQSWSFDPIGTQEECRADHRRHVADAILAALGEQY